MAEINEGKCLFCEQKFSKRSIKRHLDSCKARKDEYDTGVTAVNLERYFCISIQGYYDPEYWIYIDMPTSATLKVLDSFLRNIWLECCGHLSMFEIDGSIYSISPDRDYRDRRHNNTCFIHVLRGA